MGGDHGAAVVVPGAELSLSRHPGIEFLLFGDRTVVEPLLDARPRLKAAASRPHRRVRQDARQAEPGAAQRALEILDVAGHRAVKKGEADVAMSAGNTGALMAMAKFNLRTMARIERPAIAALWPTLGASRSCSTSAPRSAPIPGTSSISRPWAGRWRGWCSASSGRRSGSSISVSRRPRGSKRCARPAASCAKGIGRKSNTPGSSRATTSARGRWTWW